MKRTRSATTEQKSSVPDWMVRAARSIGDMKRTKPPEAVQEDPKPTRTKPVESPQPRRTKPPASASKDVVMPKRTKAPQPRTGAQGGVLGRPTKYKEEFAEQARHLCILGATDAQLALAFEVDITTVISWRSKYSAFSESCKIGKDEYDDEVVRSLAQKALGYTYEEEVVHCYQGNIIKTKVQKHVPPDTTAIIYWLGNRQRETWRSVNRHEHTGKDGGPIEAVRTELNKLEDSTLAELERILGATVASIQAGHPAGDSALGDQGASGETATARRAEAGSERQSPFLH